MPEKRYNRDPLSQLAMFFSETSKKRGKKEDRENPDDPVPASLLAFITRPL